MLQRRVLALLLIVLAPFVLWGCQGGTTPTEADTQDTQVSSGTLHVVSVLELPDSAVATLPSEALQQMGMHGWVRSDVGFERHEDPTSFSVRSGNVVSKVGPDGAFQLTDREDCALYFKDVPLLMDELPLVRTVDAEGNVHMTMTLSVRAHDELHQRHGGHHTNSHLPCLDYNGPYGNQKDNQWWGQAGVNFVGSDCDLAFVTCVQYDYSKSPICNGSFNCSSLIGHCTGYHKHTYYGGPGC